MPLIDFPAIDELDEETRELIERQRTDRDNLPSFTLLLANNPAVLEVASAQFWEVVFGGDVDGDLKQLAFVVVSQENECPYCAATHGDMLVNGFDVPESHLDAVAERNYEQFDDRERAVAEFARQGAVDPKRITDEHVDALRDVGFDDADVVELLAVVGQAAFANTIADAMNLRIAEQDPDLESYYPSQSTPNV